MTRKKQKTDFAPSNSKILHDTMVTLGALKEQAKLHDLPMNEIQVHILDKDGDGIVLSLEYDELTGELSKSFCSVDEHYAYGETVVEVELEDEREREDEAARTVFDEEYDEILEEYAGFKTRDRRLLN